MNFEQLKADMEAGTQGDWVKDSGESLKVRNGSGSIAMIMQTHLNGRRTSQEVSANARRIARVPQLERIALAAEALAEAALKYQRADFETVISASDKLTNRLAAYREATK